ncbi:MAG: hypothetical protein MUF64_07355 [Polyangiaceae bacterium]|nr:hypothetical protein [Polyangiaceae bacterium]
MADTKENPLDLILERSSILAPAAVFLGAAALGAFRGPGAAVLALAGGTLLGAVAGLWGSLRILAGDAPISLHEAIDLGAPSELQERKQKILLALKDLQREHSLGKISDEDFKELSARYRAEAKQLLRDMDEDLAPARQKAEALLAARLQVAPASALPEADPSSPSEDQPDGDPPRREP